MDIYVNASTQVFKRTITTIRSFDGVLCKSEVSLVMHWKSLHYRSCVIIHNLILLIQIVMAAGR